LKGIDIVRKLHSVLLIAVLFCVAAINPAYGQGGTSQYIYDANGRLGAVIAPSGSAAVYHYDAAGNLTSIEQIGAGGFSILSFSPQQGTIGDQVTLTGVGLDTATSVSFNGTPSTIVSAAPTSLVTTIPQGASTGLITVSGVRGSASSSTTFSVVARVEVSPGTVEILPGEVVLFQANVVGTPNQQVTWAVNGISGGNSSVGTISASGFYQSPTINNALEVTVSAISQADTAVSGQADVRILNPNTTSEIRSPLLTVSVGLTSSFIAQTPLLAVLKGNFLGIEASPLAVALGEPLAISSRAVSATTGPVITAISPATLTRGTSPTVTLTGQNLGGATAVSFSTANGGVEGNITASNISVSNGTTLTFTAAVGASAAAGTDVVIVTTANGKSQVLSTGGNTVTIQ
jgi:trimeric autotransporter adhesin